MTSREQECVDHAERYESLRRALRILRDLRGIEPRTAVHDAAFHFALVEYAKPYATLDGSQKHRTPSPPSTLPPENLALHKKILALRNRLLAQPELTLDDAISTVGRPEGQPNDHNAEIAPAPPLEIDPVIDLIERSLDAMALEKDDLMKSLNASRARRRITIKTVEITIKTTGTMAALLGLLFLAMMAFFVYISIAKRSPTPIGICIFFFGIGLYLIYFAYLAFFEYSPLAVRHFCGLFALLAFGQVKKIFDPSTDLHHVEPSGWTIVLSLAYLVAIFWAYRFVSHRLSQFLFPGKV